MLVFLEVVFCSFSRRVGWVRGAPFSERKAERKRHRERAGGGGEKEEGRKTRGVPVLDLLSAALSSTSGTDGTPALSAVSVCTAAAAAVEGTGYLEKLEIFVRPPPNRRIPIPALAGGEPFWYLEHLPRYTPLCDTRRTAAGIADFPPWVRGWLAFMSTNRKPRNIRTTIF